MQSLNKFKRILIYIVASYLVIGGSFEIFSQIPDLHGVTSFLRNIALFALFILVGSRGWNKLNYNGFGLLNVLLLTFVILSGTVLNLSANVIEALIMINLLFLFIRTYENEYQYSFLFESFSKITCLLGLVSTTIWLIGPVLNVLNSTNGYWVERGPQTQYMLNYCYLCFTTTSGNDFFNTFLFGNNISLLPNNCIFREKAFAATTFFLALIYEMFIKKDKSRNAIVILTISLFSTLSMTSILLGIMAIVIFILSQKGKSVSTIWIWGIPIIIISFEFLQDVLLEKSLTHSGESRTSDLINGIEAWANRPFFGYGYNNTEIYTKYETGYSNSISVILVSGGIYLALLYVVPLIKAIKTSIRSKHDTMFAFVICLVMTLLVNRCAFNINIFYILLFLAISFPKINYSQNDTL